LQLESSLHYIDDTPSIHEQPNGAGFYDLSAKMQGERQRPPPVAQLLTKLFLCEELPGFL